MFTGKKGDFVKRLFFLPVILAGMLLLLSGCFALPIEDPPPPPPIVHVPQAQVMRIAPVMRGDVIRYVTPFANYVPAREERMHFEVNGLRVMNIYVTIGDEVKEGDVLATLYWPEISNRHQYATRREDWLELELSQLIRRRRAGTVDNAHYRAERARLERELEILAMELDYLDTQNQHRYMLAPMDGTVTAVAPFIEGMLSNIRLSMVTIVDQSRSIFMVRPTFDPDIMAVGNYFTLYLNGEPYRVAVVNPAEYGIYREIRNEVYLVFTDDDPVIPTRPIATVHVVLGKAQDVLNVPIRALHRASDRVFVFVLNPDGIRVLRDVEAGLRGNFTYEIISGLYEGEMVIFD